jgi:hypothetical protein
LDENKLYTVYELRYDAVENNTEVSASFFISSREGKQVILEESAEVFFQNDRLQLDETNKSYSQTFQQKVTQGSFFFSTSDSKVYENKVVIDEVGFDINNTIAIDSEQLYELHWEGKPLQTGESMKLIISDNRIQQNVSIVEGKEGSKSITITPEDMEMFEDGEIYLQWIRRSSLNLQEGTSYDGERIAEYHSERIKGMVFGS